MVEELKNKKSHFHDGFLPMEGDVDVALIRYKTLDEVPVCIPDGGKEAPDWFIPEADLHRIWVYPASKKAIQEFAAEFRALKPAAQKNPLAVQHYTVG